MKILLRQSLLLGVVPEENERYDDKKGISSRWEVARKRRAYRRRRRSLRSNAFLRPSFLGWIDNEFEELLRFAEVRNDRACASLEESLAFPRVDSAARIGFVRRDADGVSSDFANIFDLDVTVAESDKFSAVDLVRFNEPVDDHRFGKCFVVVLSAVNSAVKIFRKLKELNFLLDVTLVGAACKVKLYSRVAQDLKEFAATGNDEIVGIGVAAFEEFDSTLNSILESPQIFLFVKERVERRTASRFDLLGETNALVDRLLAGDLVDVIARDSFDIVGGFDVRVRDFRENFAEIGDHNVLPPLANQA